MTAVSCADGDLENNDRVHGNGELVRFRVNDVQEEALSRGVMSRGVMSRGAITPGLCDSDLAGQKLEAYSNANIDVCLIETTVEGVNPVKSGVSTRARIVTTSTLGDFSSSGIRGTVASGIITSPEWFHAKRTKSNGELYTPIYWSFSQPKARFFAVHPNIESYSKMVINETDASGSPSVDFTVEGDVTKQVDLMTACSGDIEYAEQGVQPTTSLDFRHALTAIRFAVGQNLSWNKTIDRVELRNAVMKSRYVLSKQFDGTGADWDHSKDSRGTAFLSGVSVSTNRNPNVTIMGDAGDNYTFYMIPQKLTGSNVEVYVHCTDGTTINVPLKGEWKAGTTRTYKLSQINSTWTYVLTPTDPERAANYDENESQAFGITSYRYSPGSPSQRQAVPWKVVGYDANDDGKFSMEEKPDWLTTLSLTEGEGGTAADQGTASFEPAVTDFLDNRNKELKEAQALGTVTPYDLSTKGGSVARNTANAYLISAPGHYRIPLVYGNAIKNGENNPGSYKTNNRGTYILRNFQDHAGQDITDPWIEKTNGGSNRGVDGAEVVWADAAGLVHLSSTPIVRDAAGNAYLDFTVPADNIQSGNAVVAVKKGNTVVWSWHLWFAPEDVLSTIPVTNKQGKVYNFTKETLGWTPTVWEGSSYDKDRMVKVGIEQTVANNGIKQFAVINLTRKAGCARLGSATFYQFGRKDAFPGVSNAGIKEGGITATQNDEMTIKNGIQNPGVFYPANDKLSERPTNNYSYYNLWSINNTGTGFNDNVVVKTVYDPCPAGFKMPASNAFTGFTGNGKNGGDMNVDGTDDGETFLNNYGHNFWTNSQRNATIYFPVTGLREKFSALLNILDIGCYWLAIPSDAENGCFMEFSGSEIKPLHKLNRQYGHSVRPVLE